MKTSMFITIIFISTSLFAQKKYDKILQQLDEKASFYSIVAQDIWELAEMGYQEEQSSALLQKTLSDQGFTIETGVAEIPTAFVASYGSGSPVIAVLGELCR